MPDTVDTCKKCRGTGERRGEDCAPCGGQGQVIVIALDDGTRIVKPARDAYTIELPRRPR